jgi:hypothetical protein
VSIVAGLLCLVTACALLYVFIAGVMGWHWREAAAMVGGFMVLLSILSAFCACVIVGWGLLTEWGK